MSVLIVVCVCVFQVPQRKNQTGYFDSLLSCKGLPWATGKRYLLCYWDFITLSHLYTGSTTFSKLSSNISVVRVMI